MHTAYANEIARKLGDCATDMASIVRYPKFTRENIEQEAMDTLGRLMIARDKHIHQMHGMHLSDPAINSIYESVVYELYETVLWFANEYEKEKACPCPESLHGVCQIIWEASRLYRHVTTEENEESCTN